MPLSNLNKFSVNVFFLLLVSSVLALCTSGCSLGEAKNTLTLTAMDENGNSFTQISQGERALFTATLLYEGSDDGIQGAEIEFSISTGLLSEEVVYTNQDGQATVVYDSTTATPGVNLVTVTYTEDEEVYSQSFSFEVN